MKNKMRIYRLCGIENAIDFLRPAAKFEFVDDRIVKWDDPRPCPSMKEVMEVLHKIRNFEDSIDTIWTDEQIEMVETIGVVFNLRPVDGLHEFRWMTPEDAKELVKRTKEELNNQK